MSEFRKYFLALALVALCAATASAQPVITCNTTANPLTMRAEGLSELGGDVVLQCTGGTAPAAGDVLPRVNISVTLTTNLTSRIIAGTTLMEAVLMIDDPAIPVATAAPGVFGEQNAGAPGTNGFITTALVATGVAPGVGGATTTVGGAGNNINVYQGLQQNANTVVFLGVPINAPGAGAFRTYRIKNLRAAVSGASAPNGQVFGFLSIQNPPANLQLNNASGVVGFVQTGLTYAIRNAGDTGGLTVPSFAQCATLNNNFAVNGSTATSLGTGGLAPNFAIRFTEGYAGSWKVRGFPGFNPVLAVLEDQYRPTTNYNSESGWYNTAAGVAANGHGVSGIASHGTRLRAVFNNVPANVFIYRTAGAINRSATGVTAYGVVADSFGANPGAVSVASTPTSTASVPAGVGLPVGAVQGWEQVITASGTGSATWEIYAADANQTDFISFAFLVAFRASANPGLGTATMNGTFAPISSVSTASSSAPIPRFAETGTAGNVFTVASCITNLLFPYVTNQNNFDTGIAITNTSTDIFSTTAQQGTCTINYFGEGAGGGAAPSPQTTTSNVTSARVLTFSLFNGGTQGIQATPGFQGYIIAVCNFRYAHGFAFVSDVGANRLSHGYLALVMDNSGAPDSINRSGVTGENFGQ